jgi:hypothetical protein
MSPPKITPSRLFFLITLTNGLYGISVVTDVPYTWPTKILDSFIFFEFHTENIIKITITTPIVVIFIFIIENYIFFLNILLSCE